MSRIEELENEIKGLENRKIELLKELEVEKQKQEFDYPLECEEKYWYVASVGDVRDNQWTNHNVDRMYYNQGHVFKTQEEAERERDKRTLLTRFRQFRDKCNGDWKADFLKLQEEKYSIQFNYNLGTLTILNSGCIDGFRLFGYFKELKDAERAIELFGDKIKRLFVEEK